MTDVQASPIPAATIEQTGRTCGSCKYGCTADIKDMRAPLDCRRFPPTLTQFVIGMTAQGPNIARSTAFPQVPRLGPPCGEWVPRLEKQN